LPQRIRNLGTANQRKRANLAVTDLQRQTTHFQHFVICHGFEIVGPAAATALTQHPPLTIETTTKTKPQSPKTRKKKFTGICLFSWIFVGFGCGR
jgi:hypothetical protein